MVSVVISTYNYGHFIAEAIQSVIAQTYNDLECIIVDNGSTDDTRAVVESISDSRVQYIKQENRGVSHGRNTGLKVAKGEYIMFLDADDLIEKNKIKEAAEYLDGNAEVDLVYSDMRYFKNNDPTQVYRTYACVPDDKPWMPYLSGQGKPLIERMLYGNIMVITSPVFRKNALEKAGTFDESLEANEDWDLWLRMLLAEKKIQYLEKPDTLALIRIHHSSLSRDVFKMQVCGLRVLIKNADSIQEHELGETLQQRIASHVEAIRGSLLESKNKMFQDRVDYLRHHHTLPLILQKGNCGFIKWWKFRLKMRAVK